MRLIIVIVVHLKAMLVLEYSNLKFIQKNFNILFFLYEGQFTEYFHVRVSFQVDTMLTVIIFWINTDILTIIFLSY